jgi:hypothetical protein
MSSFLIDKLTVAHLVKEIPAFYGTLRFIAESLNGPYPETTWIQSTTPNHFNTTLSSTPRYFGELFSLKKQASCVTPLHVCSSSQGK